jgi:predicted nucleotidyltransferase
MTRGIAMRKVPPILKGLFASKMRVKLLAHFLSHSNEGFYSRQLENLLNEPVGPIGRELLNLEKIDVLKSEKCGRQKHYRINREISFFEELRMLFLKATIVKVAKKALSAVKGVELAFIYGSLAKGEEHQESDIDIMVVGNTTDKNVNQAVCGIEKELRRTVSYSLYDRREIRDRLKKKDNFISTVFTEPHILLIGKSNDELLRLGK